MHSKACKDVVAEVDLEAPTEVPEASSSREESPALGASTNFFTTPPSDAGEVLLCFLFPPKAVWRAEEGHMCGQVAIFF